MSEETFPITVCPNCGETEIARIRGKWTSGKGYEISDLEYFACPDCGEKVYTPQAMRRIEQVSPAYSRRSTRRDVA